MKTKFSIILIALVTLIFSNGCVAQSHLFKEIASRHDVESVYVGKAMLRMAGAAQIFAGGGMNELRGAISDLESVEVLECDNKASINEVAQQVKKIIDSLKLEVLVMTKDDSETTTIYGKTPEDTTKAYINDILVESRDVNDYSVVYIKGKIHLSEIMDSGRARISQ